MSLAGFVLYSRGLQWTVYTPDCLAAAVLLLDLIGHPLVNWLQPNAGKGGTKLFGR